MTSSAESAARVRLRKAIAELAAASQALTDLYSDDATDSDMLPIICLVAEKFGQPVNAILGRRKPDSIVWPRHIAVTMCKKWLQVSSSEIGRKFKRDHTSILYSKRKVQWRCTNEPKFAKLVAEIDAEVGAKLKNGKCV